MLRVFPTFSSTEWDTLTTKNLICVTWFKNTRTKNGILSTFSSIGAMKNLPKLTQMVNKKKVKLSVANREWASSSMESTTAPIISSVERLSVHLPRLSTGLSQPMLSFFMDYLQVEFQGSETFRSALTVARSRDRKSWISKVQMFTRFLWSL